MKKSKPFGIREFIILGVVLLLAVVINSGRFGFNIWPKATGVPANILVSPSSVGEPVNTDFYHAFAQGGEEVGDMLTPVIGETKALKPKIIRLDHIYDYHHVVSRVDGRLVFDFSALDAVVNPILATGAKPMLSLSYMPPAIATDGNILNPPDNWNEWSLVVQKTIEHFSSRRERNISGMYYEVWNEPDLAQFGSWSIRGKKNYLTLYHYAALGATRATATNPFSLGGPSTTGFYPSWITALVESGDGADFISWHGYIQAPEKFAKDLQDARRILSTNPIYQNVPLIITEFGFTGDHDVRYGTSYAAAHTAAVVRQMVDRPPQYLLSFQIKDGPGQESGNGWGLLGHESAGKKKKSRYDVFGFLDLMNGQRLSLWGEGTYVTGWAVKADARVKVLLVNFYPNEYIPQTVPITFTDLTPGTYRFRQKYFQGVDGTVTIEATSSSLTQSVYMPASSILFLSLESI